MPSHPLTNFEIRKYYQNEPRFNVIYSRYNLPERSSTEVKDRAYVINLDEYSDIGTHWISLYEQNNDANYFDIFWSWAYSKRNLKVHQKQKHKNKYV